jgi:hypothetical protein
MFSSSAHDDDPLGNGDSTPTVAVNATTDAQQWLYGANFVRFFITKDPNFDARTYDPRNYQSLVQQVSEIIDSSNPDLSAFFSHGGKLIMRERWVISRRARLQASTISSR